MMHYCLMLLTNEFPSNSVIKQILEPYNGEKWWKKLEETNDNSNCPLFIWDYWLIGGRYNGKLKLKFDSENNDNEYRWNYMIKEPRAGRLFRSSLLESIMALKKSMFFEEDYFRSMGANDGYLYVDGGKIDDMINFEEVCCECFCAIDQDGNAYARNHWNGNNWIDDPEFDDKIKAICENKTDGYVVFIDLHD